MSDVAELTLRFLVILNPLGALLVWNRLSVSADRLTRWLGGLIAAALALILLGIAAVYAGAILDALKVSEPSFAIGVGALLLLGAARTFVRLNPFSPVREDDPVPHPLLALLWMTLWLANPAALAAAVYYSSNRGDGDLLPALVIVLAIAAGLMVTGRSLEAIARRLVVRELARLITAILIILAVQLIVDGVMSV